MTGLAVAGLLASGALLSVANPATAVCVRGGAQGCWLLAGGIGT